MTARNRKTLWLCAAASLVVVMVYHGLFDAGFVFDDSNYLLQNSHLAGGLRWEGVRWALTSTYASNWHPLTWISHMLDVSFFGLSPRGHHATSLLLHLLNTLILWFVLRGMTGAPSRAAVVAGLFALHPLHVESVAWVSERKDVLCACLFLLGLAAYRRYVARPSSGHYLIAALLFALSLAAKPMAVSFPFVLLLLDWWPLGRLQPVSRGVPWRLVREKVPLFLLSAAAGAVTIYAQYGGGTVSSLREYPLPSRFAGAAVAYMRYLGLTIWPTHLAVYYPRPGRYPVWQILTAFLVLSGITWLVVRAARRRPWAATGWFWYLGMLIPVIGLVQVGSQSMADRYTYLPLLGIFLIVVWGVADGWRVRHWPGLALAGLSATVVTVLAILTSGQTTHWKNQRALFEHALAVTTGNSLAHNNVGIVDEQEGRLEEAIAHYQEAVRFDPLCYEAYINLGNAYVKNRAAVAGITVYRVAAGLRPRDPMVHVNLGNALAGLGRYPEALAAYRDALRLDPALVEIHKSLGDTLVKSGSVVAGIASYRTAAGLQPRDPKVRVNIGAALARIGRFPEAVAAYQEALRLDPALVEGHMNLGNALSDMGRDLEALPHYQEALRLDPGHADAQFNYGVTLEKLGRFEESAAQYREALRLRPDHLPARSAFDRLRARGADRAR